MLKFWKKAGRKEGSLNFGISSSSPSSTPRNLPSPISNGGGGFFLKSLTDQIKELEALMKEDSQEIKSSRLSKTLVEIINDNEALTYFIQYLETVGCGAMIKLILDIQSFNSALCASSCDSSNATNENNYYTDVDNDVKHYINKVEKRKISNSESDNYSNASFNNDCGSDNGCDDIGSVKDGVQNISSAQNEEIDSREKELMHRLLNSNVTSESCVDAFKIFKKYFSHKAPLKINLEPDLYKKLIENLKTSVNKNTFTEVEDYILKIIEKEHFNDYLKSEYYCKYQIDVLTSNKVSISDILYNETTLFYFMEFLEQEGCTNYLEFWISALNFQQQYEEQKDQQFDPLQSQGDAMVLYDKYFSLQATSPLHLGDEIRIKVEESICREEGPSPNCFEYPRKLILKFLEINYFQQFLQSQLYFKYLSELISTIETSPVPGYRSRFSADSDCSSEISISATNTLLASEDINPNKKLYKQLHGSSISIDAQQLYDPDSLWRRGPKRNGLNFGRINALGRFETDLEPEPDKKEESRITKAVKKLVNLNEDKSKEEMAWQVAAMIVKDVTNITMPSSTES